MLKHCCLDLLQPWPSTHSLRSHSFPTCADMLLRNGASVMQYSLSVWGAKALASSDGTQSKQALCASNHRSNESCTLCTKASPHPATKALSCILGGDHNRTAAIIYCKTSRRTKNTTTFSTNHWQALGTVTMFDSTEHRNMDNSTAVVMANSMRGPPTSSLAPILNLSVNLVTNATPTTDLSNAGRRIVKREVRRLKRVDIASATTTWQFSKPASIIQHKFYKSWKIAVRWVATARSPKSWNAEARVLQQSSLPCTAITRMWTSTCSADHCNNKPLNKLSAVMSAAFPDCKMWSRHRRGMSPSPLADEHDTSRANERTFKPKHAKPRSNVICCTCKKSVHSPMDGHINKSCAVFVECV